MRKKIQPSLDEEVDEPLINLTPLIDVVFVVLISFILLAPILEIDTVDLAEGAGLENKEIEQSAISISVHKDNTIWYHGTKVTLPELEKRLKLDHKARPNTTPQLAQDKDASFGTYQMVKNVLETSGFTQMDVVLKPGG